MLGMNTACKQQRPQRVVHAEDNGLKIIHTIRRVHEEVYIFKRHRRALTAVEATIRIRSTTQRATNPCLSDLLSGLTDKKVPVGCYYVLLLCVGYRV